MSKFKTVRLADVPDNMTQEEEARYWDSHTIASDDWEEAPVGDAALDTFFGRYDAEHALVRGFNDFPER